jgi:hypothetical protein
MGTVAESLLRRGSSTARRLWWLSRFDDSSTPVSVRRRNRTLSSATKFGATSTYSPQRLCNPIASSSWQLDCTLRKDGGFGGGGFHGGGGRR